jgi:hypothetical protein
MSEDRTVAAAFSLVATGTLQVNVTGLPGGVNAAVQVTGPGMNQTLTGTNTLSNLVPGSYTVTASSVTSGATYSATVTGSPAAVSAGATATTTVAYAPPPGASRLAIVTAPTSAVSQKITDVLARAPLSPQPVLELRNTLGQAVPEAGRTVTATIAGGTGALGTGRLSGTLAQVTNAQGRATFTDLGIEGCGPYTVTFASPGLAPVTSSQLTVTSPAGNLPPVPRVNGPYSGTFGQSLSFSRAGSYDPETDWYDLWNFGDGSGNLPIDGATVQHTYVGSTAAVFNVTYTMVDLQCASANSATTASIAAASVPTIVTTSLPNGTQNQVYTSKLEASGGTGSYAWSIVVGSLPVGLTLNGATGLISGTPTAAAVSNFTVRVSSGGQTADRAFSIDISGATVVLMVEITNFASGVYGGEIDPPMQSTTCAIMTNETGPILCSFSYPAGTSLSFRLGTETKPKQPWFGIVYSGPCAVSWSDNRVPNPAPACNFTLTSGTTLRVRFGGP